MDEREIQWAALATVAELIKAEIDRRYQHMPEHQANRDMRITTMEIEKLYLEMHERAHNAHILAYDGAVHRVSRDAAAAPPIGSAPSDNEPSLRPDGTDSGAADADGDV